MADIRRVIIDAGHGGDEPGAVYSGRQEKDDTLKLAFDLGSALERRGIQAVYTRVKDVYDSPYEKAEIGNNSGADYFVSLHRNAMPEPGTASGTETLVYENSGTAGLLGKNISGELKAAGWNDLGVMERPGLAVLRKTKMPAVLVEAGFIDNTGDNAFFDGNLATTAEAIARGIEKTFEEEESMPPNREAEGLYAVQTGVYRIRENADRELETLRDEGFPAYLTENDGLYFVRAGAFRSLENAARTEQNLRSLGHNTVIVRT